MVFRGLSLISTLLTPLGLPSFGTKFTLTMGKDPGLSSLVENQGLLPKCGSFRLVLQHFGSISDIILSTELKCSVKSYVSGPTSTSQSTDNDEGLRGTGWGEGGPVYLET